MKSHIAIFALASCVISVPSYAVKLINDDEAKLPDAVGLTNRGISRGPGIKLLSPDASSGVVKSPFNLKVAFEPHGGAKIDPATVKITYLKTTPIDLLDRVKSGLSPNGIDLAGAEVPPGDHQIQVSLQDSEGRKTSAILNLKVAK